RPAHRRARRRGPSTARAEGVEEGRRNRRVRGPPATRGAGRAGRRSPGGASRADPPALHRHAERPAAAARRAARESRSRSEGRRGARARAGGAPADGVAAPDPDRALGVARATTAAGPPPASTFGAGWDREAAD